MTYWSVSKRMGGLVAAAVFGVTAMAGVGTARAEYPEKPITLVVPYRAGGSTETMGRVFSAALEKSLGQKVVVKTRPGAGGAVGATEVAAADPDGYTLLFAASATLLWPPLTQNVAYDLDSFDYVAQITEYQQAIVAKADAPFDTLEELIEYAKENKLNYADQNPMSRAFINFIAKTEGIDWTAIPTKGGGEMVPFLLGGKVDFAWSGGIHGRYGGDMKVLASMNAGRLEASSDVASISETYGVAMPSHALIVAPRGTPEDILATLEAAIAEAAEDDKLSDLLTNKLKFPVKFVPRGELNGQIQETVTGLRKVVETTK